MNNINLPPCSSMIHFSVPKIERNKGYKMYPDVFAELNIQTTISFFWLYTITEKNDHKLFFYLYFP